MQRASDSRLPVWLGVLLAALAYRQPLRFRQWLGLLLSLNGFRTLVFADGPSLLGALRPDWRGCLIVDIRMPGMDGVALLTAVKARWPDVAHLMLSGYGAPALVSSAIPVTHQFIDKPCDGPTLKRAIERVFALQDLLANRELRGVIGQIDSVAVSLIGPG